VILRHSYFNCFVSIFELSYETSENRFTVGVNNVLVMRLKEMLDISKQPATAMCNGRDGDSSDGG